RLQLRTEKLHRTHTGAACLQAIHIKFAIQSRRQRMALVILHRMMNNKNKKQNLMVHAESLWFLFQYWGAAYKLCRKGSGNLAAASGVASRILTETSMTQLIPPMASSNPR